MQSGPLMKHLYKSFLVFVGTAIFCGALAGCGQVEVPDNVAQASIDLVNFPLEPLQANQILVEECARSKGYDVSISLSVTQTSDQYIDAGGILESQKAAESSGYAETIDYQKGGYNTLSAFEKTLSDSELDRFSEEVNGEMADNSTNPDACETQAVNWLYGSEKKYADLINTANEYFSKTSGSALGTSTVLAAISDKYVPCMAKAGYEVTGLKAAEYAQAKFGQYRLWNEPPSEEEKVLALQDYECQEKADIKALITAAFRKNAGQWMAENEATLLERHEQLTEAKNRANKVISGEITYEDLRAAQ